MTTPSRRERQLGLLVLGIAVVLLVSSVTWFTSDRAAVGLAQLFAGAVLAGAGVFLTRRAARR
jgi:uncharacterized membrane-anchored protein